jgi:hypothetical protein
MRLGISVVVALLVGYGMGHHRPPTGTVPSTATTRSATPRERPAAEIRPAFTQTGATCSVQHGHRLQLGIQIENQTTSIVHITKVVTNEPLPGLHPVAARVGVCGLDRGTQVSFDPAAVAAGAATWVTVTVQVLVSCPGADPVQFVVHYGQGEQTSVEKVAGFADLGDVPYEGCAHES